MPVKAYAIPKKTFSLMSDLSAFVQRVIDRCTIGSTYL